MWYILKQECYDVGDRWYLDLLWCSFFRVYKCQIIMILEEGPTDFMRSPPRPQNSDLPVKDDSMQYLKTIQKSVFLVVGKNYWMDVIKIISSGHRMLLSTAACHRLIGKLEHVPGPVLHFPGKQASICS